MPHSPVHIPSVLHEEVVDQHGTGQGSQCRHHFPLPPGASQTAERLPQVHQRGGHPVSRPHLSSPLRRKQSRVPKPSVSATHGSKFQWLVRHVIIFCVQSHVTRFSSSRFDQVDGHQRLEEDHYDRPRSRFR